MEKEKIAEKVENLIMPNVSELGLELVDVEYIQDGAYFFLRVYVEKLEGDISLEDCAALSNAIEERVDAVIEDKFFLEVSSPGLERPLKKIEDYERFKGEKAKLLLKNKIDDTRNIVGYLVKAENGIIYLDIDGLIHEINFEEIKKANLVFEFNDFLFREEKMKGKDLKVFLEAVEMLEREKGIPKETLLETIEQALLAAYKKNYEEDGNVEVVIDRNSGDIKVLSTKEIVEEVLDKALEIGLEDALKVDKKAQMGDFIKVEEKCEEFKRNAVQNGKQIVIQKVREAERTGVYENFKAKEHTIINGIIRRIDERKNIHIEFDKTEAILPMAEQSIADRYRVGERIKVYVVEVEKKSKFPKIVISRKHEDFLKELFRVEIPEIDDGTIEIKSVSREAGSRAKVAVYSTQEGLDTVGACIGQKGQRIKTIVDELNGEKIDIIEWVADKAEFVKASLSPAQVKTVEILEDHVTARVVVHPSQLSLAIGKSGQNARLAAKLTNMRIDIKTEEVK